MTNHDGQDEARRASTAIEEVDAILGGGLRPERLYLIDGDPEAGQTTVGLQFLLEGRSQGGVGLHVTLSECRKVPEGIQIGEASHNFQGVLTRSPQFVEDRPG